MEHTNVQLFEHTEFGSVRVVMIDGEPWFVAVDVCRILEISNSRDAVARLDDDEKADVGITDTSSNGVQQRRTVTAISESGLYALIFTSRKPEAKKFRKWVTHEVLPSIRKTGGYSIAPADPLAVEHAKLAVERERIAADLKIAALSFDQKKIEERIENARQLKGIAALTSEYDFRKYLLHEAAKYITDEEFVSDRDYDDIPPGN